MRRVLLFCTMGLASHSLFAFSSNNSCLPVLVETAKQLGALNDNMNGTMQAVDKILIFERRIIDETIPEILDEYRRSVPEILDQIASISTQVEEIRKLADERTSAGFIIGVTIGAAFTGVITVLMTKMSINWAHARWFKPDTHMSESDV